MLTVGKKQGLKKAMFPKARLGAIVGIEDNMPAYRVYDFDQRGVILKIPFAQVVTHEGHFPFKSYPTWSYQEKELPGSFIPSMDARQDQDEWARYECSAFEEEELGVLTPAAEETVSSPGPSEILDDGLRAPDGPEIIASEDELPLSLEPLTPKKTVSFSDEKVPRDLVQMPSSKAAVPKRGDSELSMPAPEAVSSPGPSYGLRRKEKVAYVVPPQKYRKPLTGTDGKQVLTGGETGVRMPMITLTLNPYPMKSLTHRKFPQRRKTRVKMGTKSAARSTLRGNGLQDRQAIK
jgi:hypothetical protein